MILLSNGSATSGDFLWPGGRGAFVVNATFGIGSVTLQMLGPNGTTYVNAAAALTADGMVAFELPQCRIRAFVASATAIYAVAEPIKG